MDRQLGLRPSPAFARTPFLFRYAAAKLPAPKAQTRWSAQVPAFGMFRNDVLNNCTAAACANAVIAWTANNGVAYQPPQATVDHLYSATSGWVPTDPATDVGAYFCDVGAYWAKTGWDISLPTIDAALSARLQVSDFDQIRLAIDLFCVAPFGIALPNFCRNTTGTWDLLRGGSAAATTPGGWGNHMALGIDHDDEGVTVATWGGLQNMTWDFFETYVFEAWAILDRNRWIAPTGLSPSLFNFDALAHDMVALAA